MSTALVLGKFAPLHFGHCLVLDEATKQTDKQVVVIYDSPGVTDIPLAIRAGWVRTLYPHAEVIEAWGGPSEVGLEPELQLLHEEFLLHVLRGRQISHFFSSEEYGEHVAKRLGAIDVRVDMKRQTHDISATAIRQSAYNHRSHIPDVVYKDLIRKVVFLGAPGTGKSTIVETCSQTFATTFMPEHGRTFWEQNNVDRRLSVDQLVQIAEEHRALEAALVRDSREFLFIDTDASTTAIFSDYYHQRVPPELSVMASDCIRRYDLTFLCMPDFQYPDTEDRSGEANRDEFHLRTLDYLRAIGRPYIELSGSVDQRVATVKTVLANTKKFQNPYEWSANAQLV
jgi:NadR type nicotinamide-nucleotide adenylyltransferase